MPNDNSLSEDAQPENQEDEGSEPGSATFQGVWPWAGVLTFLLLGVLIRKVWRTPARPPHAMGLRSHRCLQELRRVPARQALPTWCDSLLFSDEDTEGQSGRDTCLRPHSSGNGRAMAGNQTRGAPESLPVQRGTGWVGMVQQGRNPHLPAEGNARRPDALPGGDLPPWGCQDLPGVGPAGGQKWSDSGALGTGGRGLGSPEVRDKPLGLGAAATTPELQGPPTPPPAMPALPSVLT